MNNIYLWLVINSALIVVLAVVVYITLRQVGIVISYHGPVGAREVHTGPRVGENIAHHAAQELGRSISEPTLLVFGSPSCAVCESVKQAVVKLYKYWHRKASFIFVYESEGEKPLENLDRKMWLFHNDNLRHLLNVSVLPFAVMLDRQGNVLAGGLVNNISNVESLLESLPNE